MRGNSSKISFLILSTLLFLSASTAFGQFSFPTLPPVPTLPPAPSPPTVQATAATNILATSAQINGMANGNGQSTAVYFQYSTISNNVSNPNTSDQAAADPGNIDNPTPTSATLGGLLPGTTYYYILVGTSLGGTTNSATVSFTTLSNPIATATTASLVGSQSAQLNGTVDNQGSPNGSNVSFVYGTEDGQGNFTPIATVGATPAMVNGTGPVGVSVNLSASASTPLSQSGVYYYQVTATSDGGTNTSGLVQFSLQNLSGLNQVAPSAPPPFQGSLQVNLTPAASGNFTPGWRLQGQTIWLASGAVAQGLVTGDYQIEYEPSPGYNAPLLETVSITSGTQTTISREYLPNPGGGTMGGLQIFLTPSNLVGAGWRFVGTDSYNASGFAASNLIPGNYLVECQPVAGQTTPSVSSIVVPAGPTTVVTLSYSASSPLSGAQPAPLSFSDITNSPASNLPYAYVGQIRSDLGSATGFVVLPRVVATAAHVVFDDSQLASGTLTYVTGLQWLFQREAGTYEPVPQVPRGALVYSGYSDQRMTDATPGIETTASQNLDVAAMYFLAPAGGGGSSGYLASDAATNEFLSTLNPSTPNTLPKILVGYPVDGIPADEQGEMFATPPITTSLDQVAGTDIKGNPWRLYSTTDLTSVGGNSGGPLCVQVNSVYYPAGIYLGGSSETVIRSIDSSVISLFNQAESNGESGQNNVSAGVTLVNTTMNGANLSTASLIVDFTAGTPAGAGWSIDNGGSYYPSGAYPGGALPLASYTLSFASVPGYISPPTYNIVLNGGVQNTLYATYGQIPTPTPTPSPTPTPTPIATPLPISNSTIASVTITNLSVVYNGNPQPVSVTTIPAGLNCTVFYNGSTTPPSAAGGYTVVAMVTDPVYTGRSTATLVIANAGTSTFSQWEGYYGSTNQPTDMPLHDGTPNLLKYFFDIDPTLAMAPADFNAMGVAGSLNNGQTVTLTFRQYVLATGVALHVYTSTNLQTWTLLNNPTITQISIDPVTNDPIMQVQVPSAGSKQFIKLNVTQP